MIDVEKIKSLSGKHLLFISLFIIFAVFVPFYYLYCPVHGDEATFLLIGDFVKNGDILYRDVSDLKPPGVFYLAALVSSIAGKSFIATRILTYIIHIASAILVFFIGKKIKDEKVGMIAAILFLVGVYLPVFQGFYYMTEPFAVFFLIVSVLLFFRDGYRSKFVAGLALGMGILFKQTAVLLFGVYFLFYLLRLRFKSNWTKEYIISSAKNILVIISGLILPLLVSLAYFFAMGALNDMLYYSVFFVSEYVLPFGVMEIIFGFFSYLPILLLSFSMMLVIVYRFLWGKTLDDKHLFLVLWMLILSIPAIKIYVDHRVMFAIPSISLLAGILLHNLYQNIIKPSDSKQLTCFVVTSILVTTAFAAGTNLYLLPRESVDDQIRAVHEIEQYVEPYVDGTVYIFALGFRNVVFFFSNLTPGVSYRGIAHSEELAERVIKDLKENHVICIVVDRRPLNSIENGTFYYGQKPHEIIYGYIKENYHLVKTTERYLIYKLEGNM